MFLTETQGKELLDLLLTEVRRLRMVTDDKDERLSDLREAIHSHLRCDIPAVQTFARTLAEILHAREAD